MPPSSPGFLVFVTSLAARKQRLSRRNRGNLLVLPDDLEGRLPARMIMVRLVRTTDHLAMAMKRIPIVFGSCKDVEVPSMYRAYRSRTVTNPRHWRA